MASTRPLLPGADDQRLGEAAPGANHRSCGVAQRTQRRRGATSRVAACAPRDVRRADVLRGAVAGGIALGLGSGKPALAGAPLPGTTVVDGGQVVHPANLPKAVQLRTWSNCELAVSIYPHFSYNALGGGGPGRVKGFGRNGEVEVAFDPSSLYVPSLDLSTTKVAGLPIPPPLAIDIHPNLLEGYVDRSTGDAEFDFEALFSFTVSELYQPSPLFVKCKLSTGNAQGALFSATGEKLNDDGRGKLVGVARVEATDDEFLNRFLMLPTDCLAVLAAQINFA